MPVYVSDWSGYKAFQGALDGVFMQSNPNWHLVIVDDCSPFLPICELLSLVKSKANGKVTIITNSTNIGPGESRNIAISIAQKLGAKYVMYNDSDDISHPNRVEKLNSFFKSNTGKHLVYSSFIPYNHLGLVSEKELTPSLKEIMVNYINPPTGLNTWIRIGTETGCLNIPSSTSVSLELAITIPFPAYRVSEDNHTFLRYSAAGAMFHYNQLIPSLYRVTVSGSNSRDVIGDTFYKLKAEADEEAFQICMSLSSTLGEYHGRTGLLHSLFCRRLAKSLYREGQYDLARLYYEKATGATD